jgi:phosphoribosylglycinamide formyltransferase-1
MRVLTPTFLDAFPNRVLNIHPALLPAFPGTHGPAQALAAGVTQAGATCHLVDAGVDTGPILAQGTVPVLPGDSESTLAARILTVEHRLYPMVVRWMAEGRVTVTDRRAQVDLRPGESRWITGG